MRCYEYLECNQPECPMCGKKDGPQCWEVDGTLCYHHIYEQIRQELTGTEKKEACRLCGCIYYSAAK